MLLPDIGVAKGEGVPVTLPSGNGPIRVRATAADDVSGVRNVSFAVKQSNGQVVAAGTVHLVPFAWDWPANQAPAGELTLETVLTDRAGLRTTLRHQVVVAPTGLDGARATVNLGPGLPSL